MPKRKKKILKNVKRNCEWTGKGKNDSASLKDEANHEAEMFCNKHYSNSISWLLYLKFQEFGYESGRAMKNMIINVFVIVLVKITLKTFIVK